MDYSYFYIDGMQYCFSADNLEIVQLRPGTYGEDVSWNECKTIASDDAKKQFSADTIGINLVSGCNLACDYCYLSAYTKQIQKLDSEKLERILTFISESEHHPKTLFFIGGGEPTLNFELLKQIPDLCQRHGIEGVRFSLTTNGTTLNDEMISFFKANEFDLSISLDGNRRTTDAFRKYRDGRGVFQDVFNNLQKLKSSNVPFTCKALLQPQNDILSTIRFFETNQIEFAIDFANDSFDGHFRTDLKDIEYLKIKLSSICDYYVNRDTNDRIHCTSIRAGLSRLHHRLRNSTACQSVTNGYTIDLDGKIYTCSMGAGNHKLMIGDINNGIDYPNVIIRKCYPEDVEKKGSCNACWIKYLCGGGCFALNTIKTGDPNHSDPYRCEIEKAYWTFLITLYIRLHPLVNKNSHF